MKLLEANSKLRMWVWEEWVWIWVQAKHTIYEGTKTAGKGVKKNKKSAVWEERRVGEADEQEHNDKKKQEAKEEKPTKPNKTDSMRRMAYIWNQ